MDSMNVACARAFLGVFTSVALSALGAGCADPTPASLPDAAMPADAFSIGTDAGTARVDAGPADAASFSGCDLVRQTGCEAMAGTSCYPGPGTGTHCARPSPAMAAEGATCMFGNDCVPGTGCYSLRVGMVGDSAMGDAGIISLCLRFCDVADGAADCPMSMGMACQEFGPLVGSGTGVCPQPG